MQVMGVPPQVEPVQVSPLVHAFPSLHPVPGGAAANWQPTAGAQVSVVHGFASSHATAVPWQTPLTHASPVVQALLSLHMPLVGTCVHDPVPLQPSVVHGL